MSTITNPQFSPPPGLANHHVQTLLASLGPRRLRARHLQRRMRSRQLTLTAEDGTRLLAELDTGRLAGDTLAVLLHGWEGCSRSPYQIEAAWHLLQLGFDVLRINFRDHGESHHLNRELFNSTRTPEVASALAAFLLDHHYDRVFLGGHSLGGNFALRIAADAGAMLNLKAVVAICPPIDPAHAMSALNTGWRAYERYFFRKWRASLHRKLRHFPDLGYGQCLAGARSLDDLNNHFVPAFTAFGDTASYFRAYAVTGSRLAALQVPTYLVASADDPIIPVADIQQIAPNPALHIAVQGHGGHCGFIDRILDDSWATRLMGQRFLQHRMDGP